MYQSWDDPPQHTKAFDLLISLWDNNREASGFVDQQNP